MNISLYVGVFCGLAVPFSPCSSEEGHNLSLFNYSLLCVLKHGAKRVQLSLKLLVTDAVFCSVWGGTKNVVQIMFFCRQRRFQEKRFLLSPPFSGRERK